MPAEPRRVLVVGAGSRFLSGITYYTHRLVAALATEDQISVVLTGRLLPRRFYPGHARVGSQLADLAWPANVAVFDGLDWYWGSSMVRTARFLRAQAPEVVVLQWWTGTVLHSYLALAVLARRLGAKVVLEMHETQDVGEVAAIPGAAGYVSSLFPQLLARCSALVVHSEFDRALVEERFGGHHLPVTVIPHGPYGQPTPMARVESVHDFSGPAEGSAGNGVASVGVSSAHGGAGFGEPTGNNGSAAAAGEEIVDVPRPAGPIRLLYFGIIRPFKGVEDLVNAFGTLSDEEALGYELTVVGETWESWNLPAQLIAAHPHADRITFVNRYVTDAETAVLLASTDALVLPYHRSSSSGPLSMAIGHGLPVLVTRVGGLVEAAGSYAGAIFVPPHDPSAIAAALPRLAALVGRRYPPTSTWARTRSLYDELFTSLAATPAAPSRRRVAAGNREPTTSL